MSNRQDIESRADISILVNRFYDKVRKDEELGPIFNTIISDWDEHLAKLTDFWESMLFYQKKYKGNPKAAHIQVDQKQDGKIDQRHFGIWMNLWFETLDELYAGEKAELAKDRARNMGTHLYMKMFEHRQSD